MFIKNYKLFDNNYYEIIIAKYCYDNNIPTLGICVRVPLCYLIQKYNIGLIGLAFVCGIDRIVRAIYLRLYIKFNKTKLFV